MFTGIVETIGKVEAIESNQNNLSFWIKSPVSNELKIDQSVSHNGACLTVEETSNNKHRVTAIEETLEKTNLRHWKIGEEINIERCMQLNARVDGHLVHAYVALHVLARLALVAQFKVVNRTGAVDGDGVENAAPHRVHEKGIESHLDRVRTHHEHHGALVSHRAHDRRDDLPQVLHREKIREMVEKPAQRRPGGVRRGESSGVHLKGCAILP